MRTSRRAAACLVALLATTSLTAGAAEITFKDRAENVSLIFITGRIQKGDAARFDTLADSMPDNMAVVVLTGPGGSLYDGLIIGEKIRAKGFATAVRDDCASVCGFIWLAGTPRFVNENSGIGFHAAYTKDGADIRESGMANATVGAYLTKLGLSYSAVAFMTAAAPDKMTWLKAGDAERLGIKVTFVPTRSASTPAVSAPTQSPAQAEAARTPAYAQGREARLNYERWFTELPTGSYRDGASFWASNRSLKTPPACMNVAVPLWQQGCVDARARLAPVDQRRKSEPNYWWGWNSF